jgi:hypothetical protein
MGISSPQVMNSRSNLLLVDAVVDADGGYAPVQFFPGVLAVVIPNPQGLCELFISEQVSPDGHADSLDETQG